MIKKIFQNHGVLVYKKALISEHRKHCIFRDINCFVKMFVSYSIYTRSTCVRYQIFVDALAQKLELISKNFTSGLGALRLRADEILVEIERTIKGGGRI